MIKLIACVDSNYGLSKNGKIPWSLKEDRLFFRNQTMNDVVIMGRSTYFSLPSRPLNNRINCIVSKSFKYIDGCDVVNSLEAAVAKYSDAWLIGGAMLYNTSLQNNMIDYALITVIDEEFHCDTFLRHELLPENYRVVFHGQNFKIREYRFNFS